MLCVVIAIPSSKLMAADDGGADKIHNNGRASWWEYKQTREASSGKVSHSVGLDTLPRSFLAQSSHSVSTFRQCWNDRRYSTAVVNFRVPIRKCSKTYIGLQCKNNKSIYNNNVV